MAFSEKLKKEVKEKSDFKCVLCGSSIVEIHHIIPQNEGGPDTFDNAVALCASYHLIYGGNPLKRGEIVRKRDEVYRKQEEKQSSFVQNDRDYTYEFFMRKTCPNCPPVKEYVAGLDITGTFVDVDTKEGLERATELGILAAPTVVVFDTEGKECFRARTVQDLRNFFESHLQAKAV